MEIDANIIVRLIGVGASSLLLTTILFGSIRRPLKIPLIGLVIGGAAYLINTSGILDRGSALLAVIDLASLITPFWIWLFARRLFERHTPNWLLALLGAVYLAGWMMAKTIDVGSGPGFYIIHITSLALIIDLIYVALNGLSDDLVSRRRLIRIYLPILVGLQSGGILLYELIFGNDFNPYIIQISNASLIYLLVLFGGIALLKTDPDLLVATDDQEIKKTGKLNLSPSETVLHERLLNAMSDGQYRELGLTIKSLAQTLETPEHRLRALINQKLGHRNFSSFLNGYRIKEAQEKLADRDLVDLPILTIAMDLGYNSLAPFNRAFRAETGKTPSDFRKSSIGQN